jgi:pantothenate kinase
MPPVLAQPLDFLGTALNTPSTRLLIGLVGVPGAGKTTLAAQWATHLNAAHGAGTAVALGMDGFHLTKAQLAQFTDPVAAFARRGAPWTFDAAGFVAALQTVRQSAGLCVATWPGFEHAIGDPIADATTIPAATRIVIVEGLYLLHDDDGWEQVRDQLDSCWYLDTPLPVAMDRLAQRHMQAWGFTRQQADERIATNDGLNARLVADSAARADFFVSP